MEFLTEFATGAAGAAVVAGVFSLVQYLIKRRDNRADNTDIHTKALRYLMLFIIQSRAEEYIRRGSVNLQERRSLHHWHDLYHNGLGGNGDADLLMREIDGLALTPDDERI